MDDDSPSYILRSPNRYHVFSPARGGGAGGSGFFPSPHPRLPRKSIRALAESAGFSSQKKCAASGRTVSLEDPEIDGGKGASFHILWCPHQDHYQAFDCRVQRYIVVGLIDAFKEFGGVEGMQVQFDYTIPAGAETCHFSMWIGSPDDTKWNDDTDAIGGVTSTAVVLTVETPSAMAVTPDPALTTVDGLLQLTGTATGSLGDFDVTADTAWLSGTTGTATISTAGLVTGVALGTTDITATSGGVANSPVLTLTVEDVEFVELSLAP